MPEPFLTKKQKEKLRERTGITNPTTEQLDAIIKDRKKKGAPTKTIKKKDRKSRAERLLGR